jgi:hypothetical protein
MIYVRENTAYQKLRDTGNTETFLYSKVDYRVVV